MAARVHAVDGVGLHVDAGRGRGAGGRIRLRQVDDGAVADAPVRPRRRAIAGQVTFEGRDLLACRTARCGRCAAPPRHGLPGPHDLSQSADAGRRRRSPRRCSMHRAVSAKAARGRAIELLDMVGIPSPRARRSIYPHELSGGMRQRALIAMAISCAAEAADRRRADHRARRHRAGADHAAARRICRRARHRAAADHP